MTILPARSASRYWLSAGLALVLAMGLAATCQAGMVVKTDRPDDKIQPTGRPVSAQAAKAASVPPAPAAQRSNPARTSVKTAPPAADRPLARPDNPAGPADRAGWPACIRLLNTAALLDDWDAERRLALLEQCP